MRHYVVDLELSREQMLHFYRGAVRAVVARARSGERVQFPLDVLRAHVHAGGVSGSFRLTVDSAQRLRSFERLG